jgi:hypothetical protein
MPNGGNYGFWIQYIAGGLSPDVVRETVVLCSLLRLQYARICNPLIREGPKS